jgi:CheY-like chemotaxis protein
VPRLLLADDSVAIQRLVELTFAHEKMEVTTVGDGEAAIASITADPPDIVLADIGMPKRSGYEVAAFVKDEPRLARIPVLLLAGAFEPVDEGQAAQVRCDGVLVKPFEPQQVIARVRELLGGAVGTPTRATSAVPRPVERLTTPLKLVGSQAPKPATLRPSHPSDPHVGAGHQMPPSTAARSGDAESPLDDSLDSYFDRLDAAFATLDGHDAPLGRTLDRPVEPEPLHEDVDFDRHEMVDESINTPLEEQEPDVPTVDRLLGLQPPREAHRPAPDSPFATPQAPVQVPPPASVPATPPVPAPVLDVPAPAAAVAPPPAAALSSPPPAPAPRHVEPPAPAARSAIADAFSALMAAEQGGTPPPPLRLGVPAMTDELVDQVAERVLERLSSDALRPVVAEVVSRIAERLVREEIERIRKQ